MYIVCMYFVCQAHSGAVPLNLVLPSQIHGGIQYVVDSFSVQGDFYNEYQCKINALHGKTCCKGQSARCIVVSFQFTTSSFKII